MNPPLPTPSQDLKTYVAAAAALQSLELDEDRLDAVARQFAVLAGMAELVLRAPVPAESEPAPVYRP